jgi:hypothetical protein
MVAQREGFHQQEVRLHHSRDIYRSLRRWGMGIAPWHQLPARIGPYNGSPLAAANLNDNLFVVADATAEIADLGYEAHLRLWSFVRARPWPHIANLSHLTFRLLISVEHCLAKRLAVGVLYDYRELAKSISDTAALESIDRPIVSLEAERLGLHPKTEK